MNADPVDFADIPLITVPAVACAVPTGIFHAKAVAARLNIKPVRGANGRDNITPRQARRLYAELRRLIAEYAQR